MRLLFVPAALMVVACSAEPATETPAAPPAPALSTAVSTPAAGPAHPLARTVRVTVSPAAQAQLTQMRERIIVRPYWYGEPGPGVPTQTEEGYVDIGEGADVIVPAVGGDARLDATGVATDWATRVGAGGQAMLNINAFSAREGGPDNVLGCDLYDGPAATAPEPIAIHCRLLTEDGA